jgi:hypothetical protein
MRSLDLRVLTVSALLSAACGDDRRGQAGDDGISSAEGPGEGGEGEGDGDGDGDGADERLDAGYDEEGGGHPGDCSDGPGVGELEFSCLWAANTGESTVSKIDTRTITEEGRYRTHLEWGSPSRTSVGLGADVAVGNRTGSVVKIWADPADCAERNVTEPPEG